VITQNVVNSLNLVPISFTDVYAASSMVPIRRPVYLVDFYLPSRVVIAGLRVTLGELSSADALIGMDVIVMGDFAITNSTGVTKMTFRTPSTADIDYVKEAVPRQQRRHPDKGSGPQPVAITNYKKRNRN